MPKEDKRCAVIHAALDLVAERGFHGAPMAAVADRAEVAAGTIYRYFENKDALIVETFRFLENVLNGVIREGYPESGTVRERYLHVGRTLTRYLANCPREFRFLEQFHNSPYGVDHRRERMLGKGDRNLVIDLFEEGKRQGIVKDLPVPVLLALAFGPLMQICRDTALGFVALNDRLLADSVEACWDAVKHRETE
ncbi:MAG: TetR/AcrR family transcriptional regulator [Gemmatimonadota bacterium]